MFFDIQISFSGSRDRVAVINQAFPFVRQVIISVWLISTLASSGHPTEYFGKISVRMKGCLKMKPDKMLELSSI